ncbi:MAG TPA: protein-disulfide reductase DsbD [Gammaproteobacteria bacterium]|nr:protein-disulfide reductase DsbD [Gammaproteobacteria bacterium]
MSTGRQKLRLPFAVGALAALLGVGVVFTACAPEQTAEAQQVLPPQEVFRYEIETSGSEIRLAFDVRDGGYLYREKFGFGVDNPSVRLGPTRFPDGEIHSDEFFGEQEIYRHTFEIAIPYTRTAEVDSVEFMLELQGCDDNIGLCYPPQDWPTTIALPPGPIATVGIAGSDFLGVASDEPLPVDRAFVANPRFDSANALTVAWRIEPGYYLYRDKFTFDVDGEIQLGAARLPEGVPHTDQNFGDVEVYYNAVEIVVPFARAHPNEQLLAITAGFQGCKDESICYPPAEQVFELTLPASAEFAVREPEGAAPAAMVAEQDVLADLVSNGALLAVLGTFFIAGLGLALTPCVYPMIPILSSIIAGQGSQVSHGRSFALSVSYVLGMAVTYSVAGAITALAGNQVQAVFQQPWIIASAAGLFLVMALAMFGLFEIQMPAAIQSRISRLANRQKSGSYFGTAVIGALSALIVTTCVAPPLIAALIAIGQSGDVARGSLALFVLAIGMGTPLLLIGASAGKVLPKAGPWMNAIKAGFGVVMVGMAIWMLDRVLSPGVTLLLWALLVFMTGVFLGAFESLPPEPKPARRLAKGVGVLACLYGALMLIGWSLGGDDPLEPIPVGAGGFLGQPAAGEEEALAFVEVETVAELETLLGRARDAGQPVMVDFTADWCVACKEMEEYTFPDPAVVAALSPFMLLQADVTANNDDDKALLAWFESYGPPTIAFFDRRGEQQNAYRRYGYVPAGEFADHVSALAAL